MLIRNVRDLVDSLEEGKYTSLGSYPKFWQCADGGTLSYEAVKENWREIRRAIRLQGGKGYSDSQWRVVACDVNYEDPELYCDHTGERIESAYAEDAAQDQAPAPAPAPPPLRELEAHEVAFHIAIDPDPVSLVGRLVNTGFPDLDRRAESDALARLEAGDESAWCEITVTAEFRGLECEAKLSGVHFTENCRLREAIDGLVSSERLKERALEALNARLAELVAGLC